VFTLDFIPVFYPNVLILLEFHITHKALYRRLILLAGDLKRQLSVTFGMPQSVTYV
jgi:hypothetical protein